MELYNQIFNKITVYTDLGATTNYNLIISDLQAIYYIAEFIL